jgi:hypothetical protein
MLASACPGWVCYAEKTHGEFVLPYISSTKSPQVPLFRQYGGSYIEGFQMSLLGAAEAPPLCYVEQLLTLCLFIYSLLQQLHHLDNVTSGKFMMSMSVQKLHSKSKSSVHRL